MKKLRPPLIDMLRPFVGGIVGVLIVVSVLSFRLSTVGPGVGIAETPIVTTVQTRSLGLKKIALEEPFFLPYKIGVYALEKTGLNNLTAIRSVGVAFGTVAVISFYLILKSWHTRRIACFGSLLFLTSVGLLHASRLAVPEASYLLLVPLIYLGIKLQQDQRPFIYLSLAIILGLLLIYLPGLIWLLLPSLIWQRSRLLKLASESNSAALSFVLLIGLVALVPLGYSLMTTDGAWQLWLGYSRPYVSLGETLKTAMEVPLQIFLQAPANPLQNVGRLPLLDIASSAFVFLGAYWYFFQRNLDRTKLLMSGLVFGTLLITAYGDFARPVLLPFVYLLASAGITLMLQQWFTVFPRNPLARSIGIGLIMLVVASVGYYHLHRYFIVWNNAPETRAVFTQQN